MLWILYSSVCSFLLTTGDCLLHCMIGMNDARWGRFQHAFNVHARKPAMPSETCALLSVGQLSRLKERRPARTNHPRGLAGYLRRPTHLTPQPSAEQYRCWFCVSTANYVIKWATIVTLHCDNAVTLAARWRSIWLCVLFVADVINIKYIFFCKIYFRFMLIFISRCYD